MRWKKSLQLLHASIILELQGTSVRRAQLCPLGTELNVSDFLLFQVCLIFSLVYFKHRKEDILANSQSFAVYIFSLGLDR